MINRLLLTLLVTFSFTSFSQDNWTLYKTNSGINIYSMSANCYPKNGMAQTAVLFKFENTTNQQITIEWDTRIWYNNKESTDNVSEGERHITLNLLPNQIIESDTELTNTKLFLYKKFLNFDKSALLTRFELENIKVTITQ
jgi:hypothetical protein